MEEANEETTFIFYQIMVLEEKGDFSSLYRNFPHKHLQAIDRLWVKHSHGKFGFSVHKQIWLDLGGKLGEYDYDTYQKFTEYVGWSKNGRYLSYPEEYTFNTNTHQGHLPALTTRWGRRREKVLDVVVVWKGFTGK